jgi:Asp-tRNA(Asn)/Glu-tRNA(Gln) amidotransferase B subunit
VDAFLAGKSFNEKQVGQAMGAFMKAHGGQVDPGVANQLIKQRLTGKS